MISEDGINHYTVIKSLSRLLRSSNTKHKCKQYFCTNCLQGFSLEASQDEHRVYCEDNETVRVEMPQKGGAVFPWLGLGLGLNSELKSSVSNGDITLLF